MSDARPRPSGFTLIELMITVGIIGVLCAIAIPSFLRFQLKSKVTEATVNLRALTKAETGYFAENSVYASVSAPLPARVPDNMKQPWPVGSDFDRIGWAPEGAVLFQYMVSADDGGGSGSRFTAEARGDVDGDGGFSYFAYVRPIRGQASGLDGVIPGTTCRGTGVFTPSGGANVLNVPGPCDRRSSATEF